MKRSSDQEQEGSAKKRKKTWKYRMEEENWGEQVNSNGAGAVLYTAEEPSMPGSTPAVGRSPPPPPTREQDLRQELISAYTRPVTIPSTEGWPNHGNAAANRGPSMMSMMDDYDTSMRGMKMSGDDHTNKRGSRCVQHGVIGMKNVISKRAWVKGKYGVFGWKTSKQTTYLCTASTGPVLELSNSEELPGADIALREGQILSQVILGLGISDVLERISEEGINRGVDANLSESVQIMDNPETGIERDFKEN